MDSTKKDEAQGVGAGKAPPMADLPERKLGPPDDEGKSSGRYRLLSPHLDRYGNRLPIGTEVGTDTPYPWPQPPSNQMEGVDEAGKSAVNKLHQTLYGQDAPWHGRIDRLAEEREIAKRQQEEDARAEPVSHQQAWERGDKEFRGERLSGPPQGAATRSPTVSGDLTQPLGVATPRQDHDDPDVKVRTATPLVDQKPT